MSMTTSDTTSAIEVKELAKTFRVGFWMSRKVEALRGLDLTVRRGEIFGFLGPNGAGKSTTIKCITALIRPDRGEAAVFGRPAGSREAKRAIGFLPENPMFYEHLTGRELLHHYGRLLDLERKRIKSRASELLELVGMTHAADLQVRRYSKGMVQRIGIAQALLQDPDLVILDEPTSGLDPVGRRDVRELMLSLRARGKTVFFSTHIIPDVEMVCDRVGFLVKGKLMRLGTVPELLGARVGAIEVLARGVSQPLQQQLAGQVLSMREAAGALSLTVADEDAAEALMRQLWAAGAKLQSMQPQRFSLEELFVRDFQQVPVGSASEPRQE